MIKKEKNIENYNLANNDDWLLKIAQLEISRLKSENEILRLEKNVRKHEPYWKEQCLRVAEKHGYDLTKGFPSKDNARAFRDESKGISAYIDIRALRQQYVMLKFGRLVDEDTLEEIEDPHDMILHHITSGTYNPLALCCWDNVRIKHKKNDRCTKIKKF